MPVLVTIATISLLFRRGSVASFLDPTLLRARIASELDEADVRDQALALAEELERLANHYEQSLAASIDAYAAESINPAATAEGLMAMLGPWDRSRRETLREIVRIRRSMLDLLTDSQWDRVFR